jgi:MoxR-like ATPase
VIATANTRDRGVNEMSAALKRRFNFVTIPVIGDLDQEAAIVERRSRDTLRQLGAQAELDLPRDLVRLLTAVFAELRSGQTLDGTAKVKSPSSVLSTAELISTVTNGALMASFFGNGRPTVEDGVTSLLGTIAKENRDDLGVFKEYLETVVKPRRDGLWPALYKTGRDLLQ